MNAPSIDIREILTADITVDTTSFPIEIGALPEDLPNCTGIMDIAGGSPQLTMDLAKYEFPSIQIKVRCTDYETGWAYISSIKDSLHGRAMETWGDTLYTLIQCLNGPGFLERENQRTIFIINFNIQRR
jgi:hypothetical protein